MSSANSVFYFFFSNMDSFISFSSLIAVAKTPKLCWIVVVRVGTLVLFLTLGEMVSVFHHWGYCLLWVCHIYLLLCWGMFLLFLLSGVFIINGCWILSKAFSSSIEIIIWLLFFNLLIDWFVDIEESLHPWDKAHLVMVYDLFNVLLDSDC